MINQCNKCKRDNGELYPRKGGYICQLCLEANMCGRDATTQSAKAKKTAISEQSNANLNLHWAQPEMARRHQALANHYEKQAEMILAEAAPLELSSGEVVPKRRKIADTLKTKDKVSLDASADRLGLLMLMGTDCVALALDASNSIAAENSLEKMLAHQLAVAHKCCMEIVSHGMQEVDITNRVKYLNLGARFMDTYQKGMLTLQRIRTGGDQHITVQHVTVSEGSQAIISNIKAEGSQAIISNIKAGGSV